MINLISNKAKGAILQWGIHQPKILKYQLKNDCTIVKNPYKERFE